MSNFNDVTSSAHRLYLDNPTQYTVKPLLSSDFCLSISNGAINAYYGSTKLTTTDICQ